MRVELIGTAKWDSEYEHTTKDKEYVIFKIRYTKLDPKGLVTFVGDDGNLHSLPSQRFTFKTK